MEFNLDCWGSGEDSTRFHVRMDDRKTFQENLKDFVRKNKPVLDHQQHINDTLLKRSASGQPKISEKSLLALH